ncbi:hypothetical protein HZS_213 [Henneguya salminicola]|nr:hypothetical protein HZS_213 [Henneguya salminicola]
MIRQRINFSLTIPSDAAHLIIPDQYKIISLKILYQSFFIQGVYNNVSIKCVFALMERITEIMYRRVWEKVRENVEITYQTATVILRKPLLIYLCFAI